MVGGEIKEVAGKRKFLELPRVMELEVACCLELSTWAKAAQHFSNIFHFYGDALRFQYPAMLFSICFVEAIV